MAISLQWPIKKAQCHMIRCCVPEKYHQYGMSIPSGIKKACAKGMAQPQAWHVGDVSASPGMTSHAS
jgi:hypothetical protein